MLKSLKVTLFSVAPGCVIFVQGIFLHWDIFVLGLFLHWGYFCTRDIFVTGIFRLGTFLPRILLVWGHFCRGCFCRGFCGDSHKIHYSLSFFIQSANATCYQTIQSHMCAICLVPTKVLTKVYSSLDCYVNVNGHLAFSRITLSCLVTCFSVILIF